MAFPALGRCPLALCLALALDAVGLSALLAGAFGELRRGGRDYGDMLVYTGAVLLFGSLLGWVLWYAGNLEVSARDLGLDYGPAEGPVHRIVRRVSRRLSARLAAGPRGQEDAR